MTDTTKPTPQEREDDSAGVKRPDQGGTTDPGQKLQEPSTGGSGSAGGGSDKGFGRG